MEYTGLASQTGQSGSSQMVGPGSIQQLVSSVSSVLKDTHSQSSSIEEAMAQLETTDENFHSYELVRLLQSRIDSAVGPLVDARVDDRSLEGDGHDIVAQITEEVFQSQEYNQLLHSFITEVKTAAEEVLADDGALPKSPEGQAFLSSTCSSSATQYYSLDDSSASELSSIHQTGLMFMYPEQLQTIANSLVPSQPVQVRLDALHHLLQFPAGDLVTCDNWPSLRTTVRDALMDSNDTIADLSLKLLSRMFASRTALTTREVYASVAWCLGVFFQSEEGCVVTLSMGLDPADDRGLRLLTRYRLLNHIQNEVPSYWVRYSERIVEELVKCTFNLLSLSYLHPNLLGPVHFIALLDPTAAWFRKWMHGQYSRMMVLKELRTQPTFLTGAVSALLAFTVAQTTTQSKDYPSPGASAESGYYNERDLHYVHFVHSLCLLERLLLYQGGRRLFPLQLQGREAKVTISDLLVHLLNLMYSLSHCPVPPDQRPFAPTLLIAHLLKELASGNTLCRETLYQDVVITALIAPLKYAMGLTASGRTVSREILVLLADTLAVLASTDSGRHCLLYGHGRKRWTENKSAAVHTIAEFVVHSLSHQRPAVPQVVTSAWLFVCRQLYNTAEGLLYLEPYTLHVHIARALRALEEGRSGERMNGEGVEWEEALVDNLLNFAATPKGLLLLQQSGLMARCTQYMGHRYKLKLQVSKCEKFGYGCMVTQMASTAAGILELINSGFVGMLVRDLWSLLDGGEGDYRLTAPRTHPLDPMDRAAHKAVVNLLNLLSSYPALYEVLTQEPPSSNQAITSEDQDNFPSTVFELLDRLVLVDSEPKRSVLLNFHEAHLFGLRVLAVLVTCLDSFLYLESQFGFSEALLALQRDNRSSSASEDSEFIIVDECSVERNRILVSCYLIGGPAERRLPPHFLTEAGDIYDWPLFSSYPAPLEYRVSSSCNATADMSGQLYKFLRQSKVNEGNSISWLSKVREMYCAKLQKEKLLPNDLVCLLLEKCVVAQVKARDNSPFPISSFAAESGSAPPPSASSSMDTLGAKMVVRYGQFLGLLESSATTLHTSHLLRLLSRSWTALSVQQHPRRHTNPCNLKEEYTGFDWLLSSIFLLMRGSADKAWELLKQFSTLLASGYMWVPRLHLSVHLPQDVAYSGIHPITAVTAHHVELILQSEIPSVYSAFRMSGYTPSQICQHWIQQCFWNFLDWLEICLYLTTCVVLGIDYQVYYCLSILKFLEPSILKHTQEQNLLVFLKEEGLQGFHCADWLVFMRNLEAKFRPTVFRAMRQFS